ncbi:hypothetical protein ACA910_007004 [Epithemia clementina (nom. ined.)]
MNDHHDNHYHRHQQWTWAWWQSIYETLDQINHDMVRGESSFFLPSDLLWGRVLPAICLTTLGTTLLYLHCCFYPGVLLVPLGLVVEQKKEKKEKENDDDDDEDKNIDMNHQATQGNHAASVTSKQPQSQSQRNDDLFVLRKSAYAVTNFVATLLITAASYSHLDKVVGFLPNHHHDNNDNNNNDWTIYLSALQTGWQLWAIPIGLWHVHESTAMLWHHVAVICVTSMSGWCTVGFRYFTPYFYGVIELSTLLLIVMNAFKDRPVWRATHPTTYQALRVSFALVFGCVRVVHWMPLLLELGVYMVAHLRTHPYWLGRLYYATNLAASLLLTALQLFWATLIVQGLLKMVFPSGRSSTKSEAHHIKTKQS